MHYKQGSMPLYYLRIKYVLCVTQHNWSAPTWNEMQLGIFGISMVSCQKGPTHHADAWQIGPFWQATLDIYA